MSPSSLSRCKMPIRTLFSCHLTCALGLVIRTLNPYMQVYPDQPSRLVRNGQRLPTKGLCMFKSQQYRAKATECGKLGKSSISAEEIRKFQDLEDRFVSLADTGRGLADAYNNAVHIAEQDQPRGGTLAAEEEHVLRCLGAAVIVQWNALPTTPTGNLRHRWIGRKASGDSGAPRADCAISAQA